MTRALGHDGPMPVLDLSLTPTCRRVPARVAAGYAAARAGVESAGWPGVTLPAASVLGVTVFPVVELTGAAERIASGVGPERSLSTLALWETLAAGSARTSPAPPAPVRIVGFVATASRWDRAITQVQDLAGLGAGLVLCQRRPSMLQLLDADASNVWVVTGGEDGFAACVRGRSEPVETAFRVPATRLIEEGLFAHALACGVFDSGRSGDS